LHGGSLSCSWHSAFRKYTFIVGYPFHAPPLRPFRWNTMQAYEVNITSPTK
jgi:hypothetical protein